MSVNVKQEFFSQREVAKKLGMEYQTIAKLVASGEIKAHNFATGSIPRYKVSAEELRRFIKRGQV